MNSKFLAAVAAGALMLGASAANATVQTYDFSVYQAAFTGGSLGSVTVTDHGTSTLDFDVVLGSNVYFQLTNGDLKDALWFDLPGLVGNKSVTYTITSPDGVAPGTGDYPTGGKFIGGNYSNNNYGQGWSSGYDYGMRVQDSVNPNQYFGNGGHLTFSVTADSGAILSLASLGTGQAESFGGHNYNVVMGADLRQCPAQVCVTGPVGAILSSAGPVPEPATWGLMILGFGGIGSLLRRRRNSLALA